MFYCIVLHCIAFYCIALRCIDLNCIVLHYITLYCFVLLYIVLCCVVLFLNTPPWSSDMDPQRSFPVFKLYGLCMILCDFIWFYMILYDFIWFYMILYDSIWFYMILLTFSGGGPHPADSRMSLLVLPSGPNVILGYARFLLAFLCRSLLDWSDYESCHWLLYVAYYTAWKPTSFDYARLSLAILCRSRPPQLPAAVMKALSGFF